MNDTLPNDIVNVTMEAPILVDQAPAILDPNTPFAVTAGAIKWGRYRMPKIFRLPDNAIALTYSMAIDHYYDQGRVSPFFVSRDEGKTWEKEPWPHLGLSGMHPVVSPIFNGEFYTIPARNGINLDEHAMPEPAVQSRNPYNVGYKAYPFADCPKDVTDWYRGVKAMRWTPAAGWQEEALGWDHDGQYVWSYEDKPQNIPGYWGQALYLEHPILRSGNELLVGEYWTQYANPDGSIPANFNCYLLVSDDNARTWKRRSAMVAFHRPAYEPTIEENRAGEIVCVIRTDGVVPSGTVNEAASMFITFSKDRGFTWDAPKPVLGYGVFPQLLQLDNGVMVLSYGRDAGTRVAFSLDGGHTWSRHRMIIDEAGKASSCGYTSLLPLGPDTFLLAYGDIHCQNADGVECKSILVRQITVRPSQR